MANDQKPSTPGQRLPLKLSRKGRPAWPADHPLMRAWNTPPRLEPGQQRTIAEYLAADPEIARAYAECLQTGESMNPAHVAMNRKYPEIFK